VVGGGPINTTAVLLPTKPRDDGQISAEIPSTHHQPRTVSSLRSSLDGWVYCLGKGLEGKGVRDRGSHAGGEWSRNSRSIR